jgi:hypothetical protein
MTSLQVPLVHPQASSRGIPFACVVVILGLLPLAARHGYNDGRPPNQRSSERLLSLSPLEQQKSSSQGGKQAKQYYVSLTGSDANPGTIKEPFKTLAKGCRVLRPGETLTVREGTYSEALINCIPGGASWEMPITIAAHQGEVVTLSPPSGSNVVLLASSARKYIVLSGMVLDGSNVKRDAVKITWGTRTGTSHHIRLQNCEIKNAPQNGVLITGQTGAVLSNYNEILDCKIHGNGHGANPLDNSHYHGIYQECNHAIIQGNDIYDNGGYGVHIYTSPGVNGTDCGHNKISANRIHDNATAGSTGSAGIGLLVGDGNCALNNLVWNNSVGIQVDYGASNTLVANNTVYKNNAGSAGIDIANSGKARATIVRNNISYLNTRSNYRDRGTATVQDHNLFGVNPLFVDAPKNFHLRRGSPAIDSAVQLKEVDVDADGVARPRGRACDIGAYECH